MQRIGSNQLPRNRIAIVPRQSFTCDGRLTNIRVRLLRDTKFNNYPYIQIWRPSSPFSVTYTKIGEVEIQESHVTRLEYLEARIPLTGNNRIPVQAGDIVGFYHPVESRYQVRTIETNGYVVYFFEGSNAITSLSSNSALSSTGRRQPLIQFTVGEYGYNLLYKTIIILLC